MSNFQQKAFSSREGTTQTIITGAASAAASNAFGGETRQIRVVANAAVNYLVADLAAGTASQTTSPFLPANTDRILTVQPGQFISAIEAATNGLVTATAGTLWITELS